MALAAQTLIDAFSQLDDEWPQTKEEAARKWFEAWWAYAQGMGLLNPGSVVAGRSVVEGPFVATLLPACVPNPTPVVFLTALETAMRAAWALLSVPPYVVPPLLSGVPAPAPLVPQLASIAPLGLASRSKQKVRKELGTLIHTWTLQHKLVPPPPLGPVPFV